MKFAIGFDSDIREHLIEQVLSECLSDIVSEDKVEKMEVYLGNSNVIQVYLKTSMFEISNVHFDGAWDILQWDTPEFHARSDV